MLDSYDNIQIKRWFVLLLTFLHAKWSPCSGLSQQVIDMVHSWAPLIWLHSEEQFMPSSVDFFLPHVTMKDKNGNIIDNFLTSDKMPGGFHTKQFHLQTCRKLACPSCLGLAVFHGQPVANGGVPVYAIVRDYQDAWNTIDVVYHTFYPYNRGKDVCVGISTKNRNCLGTKDSFGNHVGDWEQAEIRFQNGKPTLIYLSVHNFGAYYKWDETGRNFRLAKGETTRQKAFRRGRKVGRKIGKDLRPNFPPLIQLAGTHPVVYSTNGSHGLWASPGRHTYLQFPLLEDVTDAGIAWNTWENLIVIPWNDGSFFYENQLSWLNYRGIWGNLKDGCELEAIAGECQLGNGPPSPSGPDDIPPPRIQRTRYTNYAMYRPFYSTYLPNSHPNSFYYVNPIVQPIYPYESFTLLNPVYRYNK